MHGTRDVPGRERLGGPEIEQRRRGETGDEPLAQRLGRDQQLWVDVALRVVAHGMLLSAREPFLHTRPEARTTMKVWSHLNDYSSNA